MSIQPIAYLKNRFVCKSKPTQKDFVDLIDTLAYLPVNFCDKTPLFDIIQECSTSGITLSGSLYISNMLSAVDASFTNLSANSIFGTDAYFTNLTALSTMVNVIDIKIYEVSGFRVTGDVDITGDTTISGILTADSIFATCGSSDDWCSAYTTVCAMSSYWDGNFCNETVYMSNISACPPTGTISITGNLDLNGYSISGIGNASLSFQSGAKISSNADGKLYQSDTSLGTLTATNITNVSDMKLYGGVSYSRGGFAHIELTDDSYGGLIIDANNIEAGNNHASILMSPYYGEEGYNLWHGDIMMRSASSENSYIVLDNTREVGTGRAAIGIYGDGTIGMFADNGVGFRNNIDMQGHDIYSVNSISANDITFTGMTTIDSNITTLTASNLFATLTINGSAFAMPLYKYN